MPTFIESIFSRKQPTVAAVENELSKIEAELLIIPARIKAAEAKLKRVADLSDDEHAAAEAEIAAARRSGVRLEARADALRAARAEAEAREAAMARHARARVAEAKMAGMGKLLDRFDAASAALASIAEEIAAIDDDVAAVNYQNAAARRAGLDAPDPLPTSSALFRTEPDMVTPDREVFDEEWFVGGRATNQMVTVEREGKQVPMVAGAELRKVRRTIPGDRRPGRRMESPLYYLCLPATRLGGKAHWPRSS